MSKPVKRIPFKEWMNREFHHLPYWFWLGISVGIGIGLWIAYVITLALPNCIDIALNPDKYCNCTIELINPIE